MKILMLGWELPPHNSGGLGVACLNLTHALSRAGAKINFVIPYAANHPDIDFMQILHATNLDPIFRYGGGSYSSMQIFEKIIPGFDSNAPVSIRDIQHEYCEYIDQYLAHHHPDIVHAHDWLTFEAGLIAKEKHGTPLIAHVHATEFDRAGMHAGNPIIHEIEYHGLAAADRIIAVSNYTKNLIHRKYQIPLSKIDVIYNSLDENYRQSTYHFDDENYKYVEYLKKKGYKVISTVGRFTIQKGLPNLMEAASLAVSKNPKLLFIFAGDGEERNKLIEMSADYGIAKNVVFTGFIRGQKLRDIYALSDIFVMSSISEPFGLTALEAAYHGDVLILTHQSGVAEIIWSALKYDFWDTEKLANEILSVAEHPALAESLSYNATDEYNKLNWDKVAKKCLNVYNKVKHKRN